jgi:diacylglycerol kinase (ATP)
MVKYIMPIKKWLGSANHAIEGILHAAKTQRHLRYHFYAAAFVLTLSYALGLTRNEFLLIALAVIAVLMAEMMNSAIEAMVDLLEPEHHERARIAKDIAAGGVFITAFGALVIGYIVLFSHIQRVFHKGLEIAKHAPWEISVIAVILVLISVILLKAYFGKGHPLSGGLPSGHAALAFSVCVSVIYITHDFMASILSFMLALMIAVSRVTSGIHRWIEVVLGAAIGAGITFVLFKVFM